MNDDGDRLKKFESNPLIKRSLLIVGSRRSRLAMLQTEMVIDELRKFYPWMNFRIKNIDTTGDRILDRALVQIGEKSLFTKELEDELLESRIDIIVHSLKDLPTSLPNRCCIGAILKREDPSDSLVLRKDLQNLSSSDFNSMLKNSLIRCYGTSSSRRIAQLRALQSSENETISIKDIRGNLNTRLDKLDNHERFGYDCLILATAGLKRCGFASRISTKLDWFYAVSQGALAVECRSDDDEMIKLLRPLIDEQTALECTAERVLMKCLEGGCSVPIGVRSRWPSNSSSVLSLETKVLSLDGKQSVQ
ncbi:Porphobilinogen deaminase [Sarcoptes scabiei]|nr:Porphobilinogen deaminase [Sarcoptes scabiei]